MNQYQEKFLKPQPQKSLDHPLSSVPKGRDFPLITAGKIRISPSEYPLKYGQAKNLSNSKTPQFSSKDISRPPFFQSESIVISSSTYASNPMPHKIQAQSAKAVISPLLW
jgi:hypothetical protein